MKRVLAIAIAFGFVFGCSEADIAEVVEKPPLDAGADVCVLSDDKGAEGCGGSKL